MMNFKIDTRASAPAIAVTALLAGEAISHQDGQRESLALLAVHPSCYSSLPGRMRTPRSDRRSVLGGLAFVPGNLAFLGRQPFTSGRRVVCEFPVYPAPIVMWGMAGLESHPGDCRASGFIEPFIPGRSALGEGCHNAVPPFTEGDVETPRHLEVFTDGNWAFFAKVDGERGKYPQTPALANSDPLNSLSLPFTHSSFSCISADHYTGKLDTKQVKPRELLETLQVLGNHNAAGNGNRDGLKIPSHETISSRAAWEQVEGSTTRPYDPDRIMKAHECGAPTGRRYSLSLRESVRSTGLNSPAITKCPYTGKLDDLSEHPVKEIIRKVLKNHAVKSIDLASKTEFDKTPLRVVPTTGTDTAAVTLTTNSVATLTNSIAMGKEHVKTIVDLMKERNIPAYGSGDYYAIGWPTTFRTLKNNLESIKQYVESGFAKIMNGEVGRYEGTRFIEQTNAAKGTGSTANAAWTNAKSDWALFMGEDTVAEAIAIPEEIRGKIPTDYGRSRGVAWYALLGFGLVHTAQAQARIIMWDSAS